MVRLFPVSLLSSALGIEKVARAMRDGKAPDGMQWPWLTQAVPMLRAAAKREPHVLAAIDALAKLRALLADPKLDERKADLVAAFAEAGAALDGLGYVDPATIAEQDEEFDE